MQWSSIAIGSRKRSSVQLACDVLASLPGTPAREGGNVHAPNQWMWLLSIKHEVATAAPLPIPPFIIIIHTVSYKYITLIIFYLAGGVFDGGGDSGVLTIDCTSAPPSLMSSIKFLLYYSPAIESLMYMYRVRIITNKARATTALLSTLKYCIQLDVPIAIHNVMHEHQLLFSGIHTVLFGWGWEHAQPIRQVRSLIGPWHHPQIVKTLILVVTEHRNITTVLKQCRANIHVL